ncbi:MAG: bifunctional metallophosphatase/5'-nucleotidase [Chloroflexi bacterium HGW-Chloroflexi-8]|nr:MAG: bifunctional metallophosphatase/5'-nucleotidase [Chloroflexi bacterium HGW-Chloroflexi-8]
MANKRLLTSVILILFTITMVFQIAATPVQTSGTMDVQILALNDFHGNLVGPTGTITDEFGQRISAGGVEFLATHIKNLRQTNPNTVVVSAGDLIGASPLISALFHDEPTIEAFNLIGLDFNAVGNHEFDDGSAELLRMQIGGCHPEDGCLDGDGFDGAKFKFLAANVIRNDTGKSLFPRYRLKTFNGVKIAFIGMTLEGTPTIVTPTGVAGLTFLDEAETVNKLVPELKSLGVESIVVLVHEGGFPTGTYNQCPGISGPIVDIVNNLDPAVDVVISGHTHQPYNCNINGMLVTSASSFGRVLTDIDLTIDLATRDVVSMSANNMIVTRDVAPDGLLSMLVNKYQTLVAPLANRIVGRITADILRTQNAAGESALGDVIADSQLFVTTDPAFGGAVVALMNPGGIRQDLLYNQSGGEGDGNVTYNEIFTVQPFGNSLVTMTLTGEQIDSVLEQQFVGCGQTSNRILQVSQGFAYTWQASGLACEKVDIGSIMINGVPIDPSAMYRVTVNNFLADGGDNFVALRGGVDRLGGAVDLDAVEDYFSAFNPVMPGPQNRITMVP